MNVVVHQAIAIELERLALFQLGQRLKKRLEVGLLVKHVLPVVATIDDVVDQASRRSVAMGVA